MSRAFPDPDAAERHARRTAPDPEAEDKGYDKLRQEEVDNETVFFPDAETLTARGKYSTIASERRELLRSMRDDLETIAGSAGRTLRMPEDTGFIQLQIMSIRAALERLETHYKRIAALQAALNELRPPAWGKGTPE